MLTGLLEVDKPAGPTSHDAVDRARRSLGVRRIGHFGTLDPFATGLLVLAVGPATRLAPFATRHAKIYRVGVRLGERSDTDDPEGERRPVEGVEPPTAAEVETAVAGFVGEIEQRPPAYSAKRVGGRRAYALARRGAPVELEPVAVRIDAIEIERYAWPDLDLVVRCGPGTYMRSLARDLGEALGTGGLCRALRRTGLGPFAVDDALGWEALGDRETARQALLPAESAVPDLPAVELDAERATRFAAGAAVDPPAGTDLAPGGWARVRGPDGFVGLGEVIASADALAVRPRRVLYPDGEDRARADHADALTEGR